MDENRFNNKRKHHSKNEYQGERKPPDKTKNYAAFASDKDGMRSKASIEKPCNENTLYADRNPHQIREFLKHGKAVDDPKAFTSLRLQWLEAIACSSAVDPTSARLAIVLNRGFNSKSGNCFHAMEKLADSINASVETTRRALRKLEKNGFLYTVKRGGLNGTHRYYPDFRLIEELKFKEGDFTDLCGEPPHIYGLNTRNNPRLNPSLEKKQKRLLKSGTANKDTPQSSASFQSLVDLDRRLSASLESMQSHLDWASPCSVFSKNAERRPSLRKYRIEEQPSIAANWLTILPSNEVVDELEQILQRSLVAEIDPKTVRDSSALLFQNLINGRDFNLDDYASRLTKALKQRRVSEYALFKACEKCIEQERFVPEISKMLIAIQSVYDGLRYRARQVNDLNSLKQDLIKSLE